MEGELGLTLQAALEQYTDRDKWRAYQEAANRVNEQRCRVGSLSIRITPIDKEAEYRLLERARKIAWDALVRDLWARFTSGELIATGIVVPPRLDSRRDPIPGQLFRVL